jgi:hypothetical protein
MKLNFNVSLETTPKPELNLSIDIPDKYGKIGLESVHLLTVIKDAVSKIKEALDEQDKHKN